MWTCRVRPRNAAYRQGFNPVSGLLAMRSTSRCAGASSCPTLLVSPGSAGGSLGRARAVSERGVLFWNFCDNLPTLLTRSPINTSNTSNTSPVSLQYDTRANPHSTAGSIRRAGCYMFWLLTLANVVTSPNPPRCVPLP